MKTLKWIILMCTLVLTGCWSSVEVNKQAFIETMYVDKSTNGEMDITLSFPLPQRLIAGSAGASGGNPYAQVSSTGKTVTDAYQKMQADQSRELSWGHTRVIVISEAMAMEGIGPILEFIVREPKLNINNAILVAPGKAKDIENLAPVFESFPGEIIRRFTQNKVTLYTTPKDFLETENGDMVTGLLTKKKKKMLSEKGKEKLWVGTGGMALFHNYKMVGTLSPSEGRGALWLRNSIGKAAVTIKSPTDGKLISLLVLQAHTKIRPSKKAPYTFNVYVTAEDDISESQSNIDLSQPKNIYQLEQIAESEIKDRIEEAFNASKKVKADVFQFGEYLSWHKPKIWKKSKKDWPAIYQDKVKLNIYVDLKIKRPGSENNPFSIKELHS
ncbi:germination protein, Ger(x)C family [Neobacillus bataviensis LMG 21833]|uniref:Germination protein, Ger(X)C family n=1 Tax=Neobacillus bataviensis LMG 21833 TaxID=1117379 RepID=K6EC88_9BACI|nr:Ger(x)C family spore germination protein [Neobacillus bataviensis]EKN71031.1 germination protein, Ger(x)C family [Neobacillus bataviensis LMG 21833]